MTLLNVGAEVPFPRQYDTVIMVNVIEHCSDAIKIFTNLYNAVKPGGVLVFEDSMVFKAPKNSDTCHPLQITKKFYDHFFSKFSAQGILKPAKVHSDFHSGWVNTLSIVIRK